MVRVQLFPLGPNLLMRQASVQTLLYAHVLVKSFDLYFFSPALSVSLPRDKAPTIFNLGSLYGINLLRLSCPPLSPSMGAV